jgi:hypothetical protein
MSALKTWILFFVATILVVNCSNDSSPTKVNLEDKIVVNEKGDSVVIRGKDTITVTQTGDSVIVRGKDTIYVGSNEAPYYSSGVFCWTEGCEKDYAPSSSNSSSTGKSSTSNKSSSSSAKKVSSSSVKISSSSYSEPVVPPTVDKEKLTMKDNRDNAEYKIVLIGSVYWMNSNLKYKTSVGTYCDGTAEIKMEGPGAGGGPGAEQQAEETQTVNACDYYGTFYTYNVAAAACPGGWRLPTMAEAEAALDAQPDKWWSLSGRVKIEGTVEYGNNGKQGYLWLQTSGGKNSLQVQDDGSFESQFLNAEELKRAYNIRCVIESSKI